MIHVNDSIGIWDLYAPAYERIRCLDGAGRPVGDGGGHVSPEVHVSGSSPIPATPLRFIPPAHFILGLTER
ncbi:hypothetical protein FOXYSP1_10241 [Fusarium oxysporum f. sp. phaseoli]